MGNPKGDADDDDGDDDATGDGLSKDEQIKTLRHEARRRRLQAKEEKKRADAAEAKLADNGQSANGPDPSDVILTLVEAGMSKDRIRAAMKLVDWSTVTDVDDAIDDLREEHPFLFETQQQQELPGQGGKGNRDRNKSNQGNRQDLINKYPALRDAQGRI